MAERRGIPILSKQPPSSFFPHFQIEVSLGRGTDCFQQWREYNTEAKAMPIPDSQTLLLPVLQVVADGLEHSSEEIRERVRVQFDIAPHELLVKNRKGKTVFHSNVDLALANLQGAPHRRSNAIEKVRKEVYKITEYGKVILKRNPSGLTIKDL